MTAAFILKAASALTTIILSLSAVFFAIRVAHLVNGEELQLPTVLGPYTPQASRTTTGLSPASEAGALMASLGLGVHLIRRRAASRNVAVERRNLLTVCRWDSTSPHWCVH